METNASIKPLSATSTPRLLPTNGHSFFCHSLPSPALFRNRSQYFSDSQWFVRSELRDENNNTLIPYIPVVLFIDFRLIFYCRFLCLYTMQPLTLFHPFSLSFRSDAFFGVGNIIERNVFFFFFCFSVLNGNSVIALKVRGIWTTFCLAICITNNISFNNIDETRHFVIIIWSLTVNNVLKIISTCFILRQISTIKYRNIMNLV